MLPTPHYPLVGSSLQVGRRFLFLLACNGRTTPHGVMWHPLQSASNVVPDRRGVGHRQVRPVDNYVGVAMALVAGTQHHRAENPLPSWQQRPAPAGYASCSIVAHMSSQGMPSTR